MVSIIGASCEMAQGILTTDDFWKTLTAGKNLATKVPESRWSLDRFYHPDSNIPGKSIMQYGHFLNRDLDYFDHEIMRISKRESEGLDPQQKLLLELVWRAFEDAGYATDNLEGQSVGVYVGGFTLDHFLSQFAADNRKEIGVHTAAGSTLTMLSNRISHTFDFTGPSLTIDTACSSSLVALNYAIEDLKSSSCDFAVVGGVNLMTRPEYPVGMSKGGFMATDGRSKSFMAEGDGYGRGEGGVVLVLRRTDDAQLSGDRIYAECISTGVNQDGRTPGITLPDGNAQKELMKSVLKKSLLKPVDIKYVEAHGTGTAAGDPIEMESIAEIYGDRPKGDICLVGSAKSNVGHLEAGSGLVGVLKASLVVYNKEIPPIADFTTPNPSLSFDDKKIGLATQCTKIDRSVFSVAVNSFGYGGSNAHAILSTPANSQSPCIKSLPEKVTTPNQHVFMISAANRPSLIKRLQKILPIINENLALEDLASCLSSNITLNKMRLVFICSSHNELRDAIVRSIKNSAKDASVCEDARQKIGFIYSGMGSQWWGMGQELYESNISFRSALIEIDLLYKKIGGFSILREMLKQESESRITKTIFAQPANFALQYALTMMLKSQGIRPHMVVGHSVGEISSGWASGILSLEDAVRVSIIRSKLQATLAGKGGMLAAAISVSSAKNLFQKLKLSKVSIAAINSKESITIAGDIEEIREIAIHLEKQDVFHKELSVEVPYHSHFMEHIEKDLIDQLSQIEIGTQKVDLYSSVTGEFHDGPFDANYWYQNVRQPVNFLGAIEEMLKDQCDFLVEIGPHPVLSRSITEIIELQSDDWMARQGFTLRKGLDEKIATNNIITDIYLQSNAFNRTRKMKHIIPELQYDFNHVLNSSEAASSRQDRMGKLIAPLIERQIKNQSVFRTDLGLHSLDYLKSHVVDGDSVLPGASLIEAALEALEFQNNSKVLALSDVHFYATQHLKSDGAELVIDFSNQLGEKKTQEVLIKGDDGLDSPILLAKAKASASFNLTSKAWKVPELKHSKNPSALYQEFHDVGLHSSELFQPITSISTDENETVFFGEVSLPKELSIENYLLHPVVLDGVFQLTSAFITDPTCAYVPVSIDSIVLSTNTCSRKVRAIGRLIERTKKQVTTDIQIQSVTGDVIAEIIGLTVRQIKNLPLDLLAPTINYNLIAEPVDNTGSLTSHDSSKTLVLAERNVIDKYRKEGLCNNSIILEMIGNSISLDGIRLNMDNISALKDKLCQYQSNETYMLILPVRCSHPEMCAEALCALSTALENVKKESETSYRLNCVTQFGINVPKDEPSKSNACHASAVGTRRVLYSESEMNNINLIDIDDNASLSPHFWWSQAHQHINHDEVAYRNGIRYEISLITSEATWDDHTVDLMPHDDYRLISEGRIIVREKMPKSQSLNNNVEITFSAFGGSHGLLDDVICKHSLAIGKGTSTTNGSIIGLMQAQTGKSWSVDLSAPSISHFKEEFQDMELLDIALKALANSVVKAVNISKSSHLILNNDPISLRIGNIAKSLNASITWLDKLEDSGSHRLKAADLIILNASDVGHTDWNRFLKANGRILSIAHTTISQTQRYSIPHICDFVAEYEGLFPQMISKVINNYHSDFSPKELGQCVSNLCEVTSLTEDDFFQAPIMYWKNIKDNNIRALPQNPLWGTSDSYVFLTGGFGGIGRKFLIYLAQSGVKSF